MKPFDEKKLISIGGKILKSKQTIAVAESVTSGLLQFALSCIPEAARFFQESLVGSHPLLSATFCIPAKISLFYIRLLSCFSFFSRHDLFIR